MGNFLGELISGIETGLVLVFLVLVALVQLLGLVLVVLLLGIVLLVLVLVVVALVLLVFVLLVQLLGLVLVVVRQNNSRPPPAGMRSTLSRRRASEEGGCAWRTSLRCITVDSDFEVQRSKRFALEHKNRPSRYIPTMLVSWRFLWR